MKFKEVKKGGWIVNKTVEGAKPWFVVSKAYGFVVMRRRHKIGKLTSLERGQLRDFELCSKPSL